MLNQVVLVGRIVSDLKIETNEQGGEIANITIAVSRAYKNDEGVYETDFIPCTIKSGISKNAIEYCKKGDVVGVRGSIQTRISQIDEDTKRQFVEVIAEKVSFLSSRKDESED